MHKNRSLLGYVITFVITVHYHDLLLENTMRRHFYLQTVLSLNSISTMIEWICEQIVLSAF